MASFRASEIPIWSSSLAGTQPRPVADSARINRFSSSRFLAVSFLESLSSINQGFSTGRITAPTTSGPARGPRPTSSMPRMVTLGFFGLSGCFGLGGCFGLVSCFGLGGVS